MDTHAPQPTTRQLLRRHATSFAIAFAALTASMLALFATKQLPALRAAGAPVRAIAEALLLAVPFTAVLTIPMAVLVAVLWEFSRLGADGTLAAARREREGMRRLIVPVLAAAAGVSALAFVVTAEIVPRANERLVTVLVQRAAAPSDRMMTIGELREAARTVPAGADQFVLARAARYEVELQKKIALPAACVILALAAVAIVLTVPRGGVALVIGASLVVFGAYYVLMIAGESLADRLVVSPFVGMWGANALMLAAALVAVWRRRARLA
jgi:lipopolysaccharide export LptBFGC system permease protein LptF